jgi:hypothetical protein
VVLPPHLALRTTALAAVLGLCGLAALPPEHVHASREHGHHVELVHRHIEAHRPQAIGTHVENDEEDPRYLTTAFIAAAPTDDGSPPDGVSVRAVVVLPSAPPTSRVALTPRNCSGPDPPWSRSVGPRAPPTFRI